MHYDEITAGARESIYILGGQVDKQNNVALPEGTTRFIAPEDEGGKTYYFLTNGVVLLEEDVTYPSHEGRILLNYGRWKGKNTVERLALLQERSSSL